MSLSWPLDAATIDAKNGAERQTDSQAYPVAQWLCTIQPFNPAGAPAGASKNIILNQQLILTTIDK